MQHYNCVDRRQHLAYTHTCIMSMLCIYFNRRIKNTENNFDNTESCGLVKGMFGHVTISGGRKKTIPFRRERMELDCATPRSEASTSSVPCPDDPYVADLLQVGQFECVFHRSMACFI